MQLSTKHAGGSDSDALLTGRAPDVLPPRVVDFDELEKKTLDILVDSLKYIATSCGIVIAMYSQNVREYLKLPVIAARPEAQALVFLPLILWFAAIIGTVAGIFPREYAAVTDAEKERAIRSLRRKKVFWLRVVLVPFLLGFAVFVYIIAAQIWSLYPFH